MLLQESEEELAALIEEEAKRNAWAEPDVSSQVSSSNIATSVNEAISSEHNMLRRER